MNRQWIRLILTPALMLLTAPMAMAAAEPLAVSSNPQWSSEKAAHLLRRAGFGGTPEQIQHLTKLGRDQAVAALLDYESTPQDDADYPDVFPDRPPRSLFAAVPDEDRKKLFQVAVQVGKGHANSLQDWWLRRMVATARPFEEKMTLFWHGHFTSGMKEVRNPRAMYNQNQFLRAHALSDFKTLVKGISRDEAMLIYLDAGKNVKSHPNENYARELMELFTMGEGNYTEQDVKEAARAFTGWAAGPDGFFVRRGAHDGGEKTFLGRTGNFDGDDIIDIIFEQPATARHLARKLWIFFVAPNPDDAAIDALAEKIRSSNYDVREAMRTIFTSDAFYSMKVRSALIKSPTELMVGSARLLQTPIGDLRATNSQMMQMGQELFQPPNVKGWDGGRMWINTSTLFIRYNVMAGLLNGTRGGRDRPYMGQRLAAIGIGKGKPAAIPVLGKASAEKPDDKQADGAMMKDETPDREMILDPRMRELASTIDTLPEPAKEWLRQIQMPPQFSQPQIPYDPMPVIDKYKLTTPQAIVDHYVGRLLPVRLPEDRKQILLRALVADGGTFNLRASDAPDRIRKMIHLVMSTPEYQLN